jgi:hypothetical protein
LSGGCGGTGVQLLTFPHEFRQALTEAIANRTGPSFIAAKIKPRGLPSGSATS